MLLLDQLAQATITLIHLGLLSLQTLQSHDHLGFPRFPNLAKHFL